VILAAAAGSKGETENVEGGPMSTGGSFKTILAALLGAIAILALPAAASARDRNHDHIPDRWEKRHHLSLSVNQAKRDQDGDHLSNRAEFLAGDNPRNPDSDGDGIPDGEENAGTIASFDAATGRLVIDLFGSETISGLVTEQTEIKCEHGGGSMASSSSDGGQEEAGEDNGQGEEEAGDGSGDHGEEQGDDSGGGEEEAGDDSGGDQGGEGGACTTADLVPGAVVQQAELEVAQGAATFHEIELAG
jgi:hypothetical protein